MKAIWIVVLAACGIPKASETLPDSVRIYNDGVRWGRYAVAANHVPAAERSQFVDDADAREKDLKITDIEVVRIDKRGDREARVHVKLSWYRESEGTLRETQAMQTWERQGKQWVIVEESRLRGAEMPGLAETLTKPAGQQ
jgi:hypothetical protein